MISTTPYKKGEWEMTDAQKIALGLTVVAVGVYAYTKRDKIKRVVGEQVDCFRYCKTLDNDESDQFRTGLRDKTEVNIKIAKAADEAKKLQAIAEKEMADQKQKEKVAAVVADARAETKSTKDTPAEGTPAAA
jgi:hypothetical protein